MCNTVEGMGCRPAAMAAVVHACVSGSYAHYGVQLAELIKGAWRWHATAATREG